MKKALVLGCGLIGKTVALDLAEDFSVTVMDPFEKALASLADRNDIKKIQKPADDAAALAEAAKDADIVCGLLPSHLEGASEADPRDGEKLCQPERIPAQRRDGRTCEKERLGGGL